MNTLKKIIKKLIIIIQRIIMNVSLFIIYYLVFGLTVAIAFLFNPKMMKGRNYAHNSAWLDAAGYDKDIRDSKMQS